MTFWGISNERTWLRTWPTSADLSRGGTSAASACTRSLQTAPTVATSPSDEATITGGELGTVALFVHRDRLAALLHHLLQHLDDERVIIGGVRLGARVDVAAKSTGKEIYAIDVRVPGMLYGTIARRPVRDSGPVSFNRDEVKAMPGIVEVVACWRFLRGFTSATSIEDVLRPRAAVSR